MFIQVIHDPAQPGGVTNAGELRLCVDLKVHINGKVMDKDYLIPDIKTIVHNLNGASYLGKFDLSDAYYQIELDEETKYICAIGTSRVMFKMCRLPQGFRNSSSIFHNCIESTLKRTKGVVIFQDDVSVYGTTKEQFDKRILAVKSPLLEKNYTTNQKKNQLKTSR